jgi:hypothetical protein
MKTFAFDKNKTYENCEVRRRIAVVLKHNILMSNGFRILDYWNDEKPWHLIETHWWLIREFWNKYTIPSFYQIICSFPYFDYRYVPKRKKKNILKNWKKLFEVSNNNLKNVLVQIAKIINRSEKNIRIFLKLGHK